MYLCTILPGHKTSTPVVLSKTIEASATHVWRLSEARIIFNAVSTSTITVPVDALPDNRWTYMLLGPLFRLTCLFEACGRLSPSGPVAVRIHIAKDVFDSHLTRGLCSSECMEWESRLNSVLTTTMFIVESTAERRKKSSWETSTVSMDISGATPLGPDVMFDWNAMLFSSTKPLSFSADLPMCLYASAITPRAEYLLASCSTARRVRARTGLLDSISAPHGLLVVTPHADIWCAAAKSASMVVFDSALDLSRQDMEADSFCVVVHPDALLATVADLVDLDDLMGDAMLHRAVRGNFKRMWRRMFVNSIAGKFSNVRTPLPLIHFGCAILDDLGDFGSDSVQQLCSSDKVVHVIVDHTRLRVDWPSFRDLARVYGEVPRWAIPLMHRDAQHLIHVLPTPKSLKKHVKLVGHQVRACVAEERVASMFQNSAPPVPLADALQRFASKPLPLAVLRELVLRSFCTWTSTLGEFLVSKREQVHQLSENFVKSVLDKFGSDTCGICFDTKADAMALCGHVYCKDCARQHFGSAWADNHIQPCAMCRVALTSGDLFFLLPEGEPYEPVKTSKNAALETFLRGLRNSTFLQVWSRDESIREDTRTVVITSITNVTAINVLKSLQNFSHAVQVHVFYTADEAAAFDSFQLDFNM